MSEGFVYVLSNPSIQGQVKVGMTIDHPERRAESLSNVTGVPTPFKVEYFRKFSNCRVAEKEAHRILERRGVRVNQKREFFSVTVSEAKGVIDSLPGGIRYTDTREAYASGVQQFRWKNRSILFWLFVVMLFPFSLMIIYAPQIKVYVAENPGKAKVIGKGFLMFFLLPLIPYYLIGNSNAIAKKYKILIAIAYSSLLMLGIYLNSMS
jgi:hypothetical protein